MAASPTAPPHTIRRLGAADATLYRDLRLQALRDHPDCFGADAEVEAAHPLAWFAERLDRTAIFAGFPPSGPAPVGMAGLYRLDGAKQRHKAVLWGMYVHASARGTGLAPALLACAIDHARHTAEDLRLTVGATNTAAIRLYERAGFQPYGREPRALKVGGQYHDELLMALTLHP